MKCIRVKIPLNRKVSLLLNIWCRPFVLLVWFSRKKILRTVFRKLIRECSCSNPLLTGRGRKGRPVGQRDKLSFHWADRQAWNCNGAGEPALLCSHWPAMRAGCPWWAVLKWLTEVAFQKWLAVEGREPWGERIQSMEESGRSSRVCCRQQKRQGLSHLSHSSSPLFLLLCVNSERNDSSF